MGLWDIHKVIFDPASPEEINTTETWQDQLDFHPHRKEAEDVGRYS